MLQVAPELLSLLFALGAVTGVALVLHADPQLVHLAEVVQHHLNRVVQVARFVPESVSEP